MALERNAFVENYIEETRENLRRVNDAVIDLQVRPDSQGRMNDLLRALHTIKGSSRMLKFKTIERVAHATESVLKGVVDGRYALTKPLMQLVFAGGDLTRIGIDAILDHDSDDAPTDAFLVACEQASAGEPFLESLEEVRTAIEGGSSARSATEYDGEGPRQDYESIRIKLSDVESITETLNRVIIKQFQFKKFQESIETIRAGFAELTGGRSSIVDDGLSADELLKQIQGFQKDFTDQMAGLEQQSYTLQEQIMRLSMLPMELVLGEMPRMVAETAAVLGKEIDFSMSGVETLMDKAILEKLNDPIIHIVRNAVDHGIESPEERKAAGKPANGKLSIVCAAESGNMIMRVRDDGRGLSRERIVRRAVERGLVDESGVAELSDANVFSFIFLPGFSTSDTVGDLSGRGVGLDIVKSNIEQVKGKVTVESVAGQGTEFVIGVPLSLATVTGFFVTAGEQKFLIPSNFVHKIVRLGSDDIIQYFHKDAFRLGKEIIPVYSLASLLGRTTKRKNQYTYVVVVDSLGERIGVVVDEVLQHVSLIYKAVPRNIRRLRPIQGIVFDENYRIINILFMPELLSRFKRIKSIDLVSEELSKHPQAKVVLVVDDSRNTREIEQSILELEGFVVLTAVDGIDGLEQLKSKRVDLVVTDINMPRMDGVTMIENIRKDATIGDVPIIVVTSEADEESTRGAKAAGANAFIVKSEFDRSDLAEVAHGLISGAQ